jgi:hypothetical protein
MRRDRFIRVSGLSLIFMDKHLTSHQVLGDSDAAGDRKFATIEQIDI